MAQIADTMQCRKCVRDMKAAWVLIVGSGVGSVASTLVPETCVGYAVAGAGSPDVDGCYLASGTYGHPPRPLYVHDAGHQLYSYAGTWKIGVPGQNVSYCAAYMSAIPPESVGGCGVWSLRDGAGPCPSVKRVGLPPAPPAPVPPPPPPIPPAPPAPPMALVFEDDFNGKEIDRTKWTVQDRKFDRGGMWMEQNVAVENGTLVLQAVPQNYSATVGGATVPCYVSGAAVTTAGLHEQRTGRWEIRVRMPLPNEASGYTLHPSLWLHSSSEEPDESGCGQEIDIIELYSGDGPPSHVSYGVGSLHAYQNMTFERDGRPSQCEHLSPVRSNQPGDEIWSQMGDFTSGWTVFTLDWTDEWITMSVNGTVVANYADNLTIIQSFTDPQPLLITMTIMERTMPLPIDIFPQKLYVDWVRIYAWAPTTAAPAPPTIFSANFSAPLDMETEAALLGPNGSRVRLPTAMWVLESEGNNSTATVTPEKSLKIVNNLSHCVLWVNKKFPASFDLRFGFRPQNVSGGLAIVFFAAAPPNETTTGSIFDLTLPPREGVYKTYCYGLKTYSDSYFRPDGKRGPGICDRNATTGLCVANLRKDPGFNLVAVGTDLISNHKPANGQAFEVRVLRQGGHILLSVDGRPEVEWTDQNPLGAGYIGLRQMSNTQSATYTHFDVLSVE